MLSRNTKKKSVLFPGLTEDDRVSARCGLSLTCSKRRATTRRLESYEEGVLCTVDVASPPKKSHGGLIKRKGKKNDAPSQPASNQPHQYTVCQVDHSSKWTRALCRSLGLEEPGNKNDVDSHLYNPSKMMSSYIRWTFQASFLSVFFSFLFVFLILCLIFAGLLLLGGNAVPECIIVSGDHFGANSNTDTKFGDAFTLSWTTFTTVGFGNVYTATGNDFNIYEDKHCAGIIALCTLEAFLGLLYAGVCTSILFGKVNRIQSHAHLTFANAVCLQYEEVELNSELVDGDMTDSDLEERDEGDKESIMGNTRGPISNLTVHLVAQSGYMFKKKYKGCPILKFQVVNDLCNKNGGEILDGVMKVVGIKFRCQNGNVSHSQYVRVELVDTEHPFVGRVWHGCHVLDENSTLLTKGAKQRLKENGGSWPAEWLKNPSKIRRKLDFQFLVVTVSGVSNLSACSVHTYKRYKFGDVIIGFDFAPIVHVNELTDKLEVNRALIHDVREQIKGHGEDLGDAEKVRACIVPQGGDSVHSEFHKREVA
ncbi:hypothetical protein ACHAWF_008623 [Thalassiosira exigua]